VIGAVVRSGERVGVVVGARPVASPQRVVVAWEPLAAGVVSEHAWPPQKAEIVRVLDCKVKTRTRRAAAAAPALDEPEGFAQWLGAHVLEAKRWEISLSVPGAGTTRRAALAKTFARLLGEGYDLDAFKAASVGVLSDEYMRSGQHVHPENVLRVEKIGRRVDLGRQELARREARSSGAETDWGAFDG
jgi:hypothetical protein